jgi:CTP:molybdopterin cytidylyltransferase MocA
MPDTARHALAVGIAKALADTYGHTIVATPGEVADEVVAHLTRSATTPLLARQVAESLVAGLREGRRG